MGCRVDFFYDSSLTFFKSPPSSPAIFHPSFFVMYYDF